MTLAILELLRQLSAFSDDAKDTLAAASTALRDRVPFQIALLGKHSVPASHIDDISVDVAVEDSVVLDSPVDIDGIEEKLKPLTASRNKRAVLEVLEDQSRQKYTEQQKEIFDA